MRIIKFRGWDSDNKVMTDVETIEFIDGVKVSWCGKYFINERGRKDCYSGYNNLMQFTGLHDKNGKEIYEGDIVKDNKDEAIGLVIYTPPTFSVKLIDKLDTDDYWALGAGKVYPDNYKLSDTEVIGNIYQNPELSEGKQ